MLDLLTGAELWADELGTPASHAGANAPPVNATGTYATYYDAATLASLEALEATAVGAEAAADGSGAHRTLSWMLGHAAVCAQALVGGSAAAVGASAAATAPRRSKAWRRCCAIATEVAVVGRCCEGLMPTCG